MGTEGKSLEGRHLFLPERFLPIQVLSQSCLLRQTFPDIHLGWGGKARRHQGEGGERAPAGARHELDTCCVISFSPHDGPARWVQLSSPVEQMRKLRLREANASEAS